MRRVRALICLLSAFVGIEGVAYGQQEPFGGEFSIYDEKPQRDVYDGFARCIVARYPKEAQAAVREGASIVTDRRYTKLMDTHCLKRSISIDFIPITKGHGILFTNGYLTYRLAQALIQKDYTAQHLPNVQNAPALVHDQQSRTYLLDTYAECVARSAPADVYSLVVVRADTPVEEAAFSALKPKMKTCSTEESLDEVPTFIWRGGLAKELYLLLDEVMPIAQQEPAHA
jgi:hypothetical protein